MIILVLYVKLPQIFNTAPSNSNLPPSNGAVSESTITSSQEQQSDIKEKAKASNHKVVPPITLSLSKALQSSSSASPSILSSSTVSSSPAKVSFPEI